MDNKNENKKVKNSYFEFGCATLFFLMGLFISNTYCSTSFQYFPSSLVCLLAAFVMGYYALEDFSNKNKLS